MRPQLVVMLLLLGLGGTVWAGEQKPRRRSPVSVLANQGPPVAAVVTAGPTVNVTTVTFSASGNPDTVTSVNGNQAVTVTFSINGSLFQDNQHRHAGFDIRASPPIYGIHDLFVSFRKTVKSRSPGD